MNLRSPHFAGRFLGLGPISYDTPDDGGGGGGGGKGPDDGGGAGARKAALTDLLRERPDIQDEIDQIIEARLARDRRARAGSDEGVSAKEREELARLRQAEKERERKTAEEKGNYEKALQSVKDEFGTREKEWEGKHSSVVDELKTERISNQIIAAAAKHRAIDPQDIVTLLRHRVRLDDKYAAQVLDDHGEPWFVGGKPASIDRLVEEFLAKRPQYVQPTGTTGTAGEGGKSTSDRGTSDGLDGELAGLKKAWDEAEAAAAKRPSPELAMQAQKAKKAYEDARRKKAA
jgi:hypothetical protein